MTTSKKKKQTVSLQTFLATENNFVPKLVTVKSTKEASWSDIVDQREADIEIVDISRLPTAPRRTTDIDLSEVPKEPPFVAHVGNLSFEIGDDDLKKIFADLLPKSARVIKDGARSRGSGFVEFETRDSLFEALKRNDKEYFSRKIRVSVSEKNDQHDSRSNFQRGGGGGNREENTKMNGDWRRGQEPRDDDRNRDDDRRPQYDRPGGGRRDDNRQRDNFGDRHGYVSHQRRENRDDRPRRFNDGDRPSMDRPRYSGPYNDSKCKSGTLFILFIDLDDPERETPKERPKLNLQPRTKPLLETENLSVSSSSINVSDHNATTATEDTNLITSPSDLVEEHQSEESRQEEQETGSDIVNTREHHHQASSSSNRGASIFGGAKPVDTTAKELEIERKLRETQLIQAADRDQDEPKSRPRYGSQSLHTDDQRRNNDRHTDDRRNNAGRNRGYGNFDRSGGEQYENNNRRQTNDYDRDRGYQNHDRDRYQSNRNGGDRDRMDKDRDQRRGGGSSGGNYSSREGQGGDRPSYNYRSQYNNNERNQYRDNNSRNGYTRERDREYNNDETNNYSRNDDRRRESGGERNKDYSRQPGPPRERYSNETSSRHSDEHS
ncbi:unnamed protein product, partial [Didymodactylos carnosus]